MAEKFFALNEYIESTGILDSRGYDISKVDKIRFVVQNAGAGNVFTLKVKIKGQSSYTTLTTLVGNVNSVVDIKTYDLLLIECTTFDGITVNIVGSGYKVSGSDITEYADFTEFPDATGSARLAWDADTNTLYYDEPSTSTWVAPVGGGGSSSLTSTYIGYGSGANELTGEAAFTYNATTNTLTVPNITLNGTNVNESLYKVEKFTLTGGQIAAKSVTLAATPITATLTRLNIVGGTEQEYGVDFTVSGTTLSWNGLGLDGILETSDDIIITYN